MESPKSPAPDPAGAKSAPTLPDTDIPRVAATPAALELIDKLKAVHGALMFHQSGGCCDGSSPMCFLAGEFKIGMRDVYLGSLADCEFYMGGQQYELWQHTQLLIDVVPGRGSGFSLEAPEGMRFLTRSRVFDENEQAILACAPPRRGPKPESE